MFTKEEVARVASLAKLKFSDEEIEGFAERFNEILVFVEHLQEVDTEGIEPTYHGNELINVFREDVAIKSNMQQGFLNNAPTTHETYIQVPAIIESEAPSA
ncbi:Asp-tRNA(Asn)/Glu-tRNA(Gln) amidotransferase subunit GatC [Fundicoccus culcitae]|uniref:Aspartyl/glutamyl-tRNA(Asn/Gln) amidotransferase subunit C n=1 Tax=Fundicoccus culcitae TaxID=2969821 RepID=A0ABY5P614_9LACT|nr:Asp-tRNA(Asn)/Glu-tRNA(Gln) amidotransferase subunit GatC [Fundicoccus culcitae]UUX33825.1 Asp-tRNA(Asn)/Glu-tRNA(Gln) amidotransferase subunit GatC [Fundicoccus culcitae]